MKTETITWNELPADGLPDAEITVLMQVRDLDGEGTEVHGGWLSGENWCDVTGYPIQAHRVVAWADQPAGISA